MRKPVLLFTILIAGFSSVATATLLDFNDENNLGVELGLDKNFRWSDIGGGHLYAQNFNRSSTIYFAEDTYLNSFEMNSLPQENGSANTVGSMKIEAYNSTNDLIWDNTVDLTGSKTWEDWIVVPVEMAAISSLKFLSPRLLDRSYKFWPSIDNIIINEPAFGLSTEFAVSPVPIPAALWLFGSAIGLLGWIQRRKN